MRQYLRRWPYLFFILPGAGFGLLVSARCLEQSRRCITVTTPGDVTVAVALGAALGLAFAILGMIGGVYVERARAALVARFPDSLVQECVADAVTVRAAAELGVALRRRRAFVLVVSVSGVQIWASSSASELLLDLPWEQVGSASMGDPLGDPRFRGTSGQLVPDYDRLLIPVTHEGRVVRLQLIALVSHPGTRRYPYADPYDLRMLSRQINGYKSVHDREADTKRG
jgi:hypothetical protein